MKRFALACALTAVMLMTSACSGNGNTQNETTTEISTEAVTEASAQTSNETRNGGNVLIAYFSWAANAENSDVDAVTSASIVNDNYHIAADFVEQATNGDLFEIKTSESYPVDYSKTVDIASEEKAQNARPELTSHVENMDDYDTVVLIYPNWWGTIPMAVSTFLEEYDFTEKTVLPLCTNEGSGMGTSEDDIKALIPDATLTEGLAVRGGSVDSSQVDINNWLKDNGII